LLELVQVTEGVVAASAIDGMKLPPPIARKSVVAMTRNAPVCLFKKYSAS
jgi:hypothetical protein